jgi:hypothetical protein
VIAVLPTAEFAEDWWATDYTPADVTIDVSPNLSLPAPAVPETAALALVGRLMAFFGTLLGIAWRFIARHAQRDGTASRPVFAP